MNFRLVFGQLGLLFVVLSLILLLMAGGFLGLERYWLHEIDPEARTALLLSGSLGLTLGGVTWLILRRGRDQHMRRREALLLTAMSWLLGAAFAALPFYFWAGLSEDLDPLHPFHSFINCYFESMSGLTTTGASVLADVEVIPRSLLLWRATTQWLGGIGIVVLFVAVLPSLGVGGRRLFRSETTGPAKEGVHPHIRDTARTLWYIYLGMTVALAILLRISGMAWFDSICHTMATVSTGGFSTRNASLGAFSTLSQMIVMVFMIAGGVNFALYYSAMRGRWRTIWRDPEFRLYVTLMTLGCAVVAASLTVTRPPIEVTTGERVESTLGNSVQYGLFNAVSLMTTTGFATADWNGWPIVAKAALIIMMFVCGSAGSTAGGIKVIRLWLVLKILHREIERVFRPQVVRPVQLGESVVDPPLKLSTVAFVLGFILLFAIGSASIMLFEDAYAAHDCSFETAATASVATLSNIGPGFDRVGAMGNYGWFSTPSKVVMCMLMALGRLEVFAIIVLFTPRFWRER